MSAETCRARSRHNSSSSSRLLCQLGRSCEEGTHGTQRAVCVLVHACHVSRRFRQDQVFEDMIETQIKAVSLIDGEWYVRLDGDLAGKVVGAVYDASAGETELVPITLSVRSWCRVGGWVGRASIGCRIPDQRLPPAAAVAVAATMGGVQGEAEAHGSGRGQHSRAVAAVGVYPGAAAQRSREPRWGRVRRSRRLGVEAVWRVWPLAARQCTILERHISQKHTAHQPVRSLSSLFSCQPQQQFNRNCALIVDGWFMRRARTRERRAGPQEPQTRSPPSFSLVTALVHQEKLRILDHSK